MGRGLHTEITTRAWCEKCHNYQPITQTREPASLPHALVVNAAVDSAALDIWRRDGNARPATTPEGEEGEHEGTKTPVKNWFAISVSKASAMLGERL